MMGPPPTRRRALVLGIIVTILWATSVILIRVGLTDEGLAPLAFAGVRFSLAALLLLVLALPGLHQARAWKAPRRSLMEVALYGSLVFCVAQIAFVVALGELSAATVGLLMGLAPVVTAIFVIRSHHERASPLQLAGIVVLMVGVLSFFGLAVPVGATPLALLAAIAIPVVIGGSARLGRHVALDAGRLFGGPLGLTALAMAAGGFATLGLALLLEGVPSFSARAWLLILWLAVVNTALTYTLWTHTQRTLHAVESSVLGDLTVILVAVLGWVALDESLDLVQTLGLVLAVAGVAIVQVAPLRHRRPPTPSPGPV
jgi:drug/metabolite transporter (DMT)-like permease